MSTYEVEVLISVEIDTDDEAVAKAAVDTEMQRAWGLAHQGSPKQPWHFEILPDARVTNLDEIVKFEDLTFEGES